MSKEYKRGANTPQETTKSFSDCCAVVNFAENREIILGSGVEGEVDNLVNKGDMLGLTDFMLGLSNKDMMRAVRHFMRNNLTSPRDFFK